MVSRDLPAVCIPKLRAFQVKAVVVSTSERDMILVPQDDIDRILITC
jgi:virulence-associated protein VagC